uniref:Uncharacterized protein n=1 Tax=Arundo donax TaxID=35708 RepID=A0A0A8ZHR8_ARUDO
MRPNHVPLSFLDLISVIA